MFNTVFALSCKFLCNKAAHQCTYIKMLIGFIQMSLMYYVIMLARIVLCLCKVQTCSAATVAKENKKHKGKCLFIQV